MRRISLSLIILLLVISNTGICQQGSYFDAAQSYNRLLIEKNSNTYFRIYNFKVIGSPYLFGEKHEGSLFAKDGTTHNIFLRYNTFNQEVEFFSKENPLKPLVKAPDGIDSFNFRQNMAEGIAEDLLFIYGLHIGATDKSFYQLLSKGGKFNLYKKYKAELGIVSTNYVQSELRQFNLNYEYFYTVTATKTIKKLKATRNAIIQEFKNVKDLSEELESFNVNPDKALINVFIKLNN